MKKRLIFALALSSVMGFAQDYNGRVGINTNEPKASLDIARHMTIPAENPQGLLLPHLTKDQRDAFNQEKLVNGLMIFNTTKNCIDWYDGDKWQCTDGSNIDYTPVNTTKDKNVKADVWDRTHYIGSFKHNGANIDGVIDNENNKLTFKIPYNQATVGDAYNEINVKRTIKDRNGKNVLLTLNIQEGTFSQAKGFLEGTIIVGSGATTDTFSVKQLAADTEETITTFAFSINGNTSNVRLIASGGVLDRNFGQTNYNLIYVPVSVYVDTLNKLPNSGEPYEKKWLNNNLGANYANRDKTAVFNPVQQATSHRDHNAYGSLFQWQRPADGHELVNWTSSTTGDPTPTTTTLWDNTNWKPNHSQFIIKPDSQKSWVNDTINSSTFNKDLWQSGKPNNPCPQGYHPPTYGEWDTLNSSMGSNNYTYWATQNPLRLPPAGYRSYRDGTTNSQGSIGFYWSSSPHAVSYNTSHYFLFVSSGSNTFGNYRADGYSVRCLSD